MYLKVFRNAAIGLLDLGRKVRPHPPQEGAVGLWTGSRLLPVDIIGKCIAHLCFPTWLAALALAAISTKQSGLRCGFNRAHDSRTIYKIDPQYWPSHEVKNSGHSDFALVPLCPYRMSNLEIQTSPFKPIQKHCTKAPIINKVARPTLYYATVQF